MKSRTQSRQTAGPISWDLIYAMPYVVYLFGISVFRDEEASPFVYQIVFFKMILSLQEGLSTLLKCIIGPLPFPKFFDQSLV